MEKGGEGERERVVSRPTRTRGGEGKSELADGEGVAERDGRKTELV